MKKSEVPYGDKKHEYAESTTLTGEAFTAFPSRSGSIPQCPLSYTSTEHYPGGSSQQHSWERTKNRV